MKDKRDNDLVDFLTWALNDPKRPLDGKQIVGIILTIISASMFGLAIGSLIAQSTAVIR